MGFVRTTGALAASLGLIMPHAPMATCDSACQAGAGGAIYSAISSTHDSDGVLMYSVGTLCGHNALKAKGQQLYSQTFPQAVANADAALKAKVPSSADYAPYATTLETTVRVARSAEASGVIAGLRSAFAMYPGSKAEYCSRMIARLGG